MAPPVTTAGYGGYSSQPPATSAYSYENPMQPMSHASQHPSYPAATQAQRVEVTHAQNVSPSMAHLPHHQQHAQQHTQRPPVGYGMPGYHHTMAPSGYPTYAPVHADYRRADPTSGSLPSMRTLDQASSMSGPMAHSQHMMMMQSHEMNYYPHMMAQQYGMHPEMLGRYPLTHDPRFALTRTPKKEIKRRTKTGCMTCRKRRIKCDETHPTCNNCKKSKRECLGYDPIFKQQNQGQPAPHLHQPQANLSPSQKSVKQSPGPQQLSTSQSPSQQHTAIKQEPLPPMQQQSSQIQSNSRPSSQQMQSSSMGPASTASMSSSSIHSTSSHMSNQLPTTPATQGSYKATPPLSSNYPTPTSTSVSASSYDNNIQSHSPGHGNSYDYQNIDPALANGSVPRPSYQNHEPHYQPRMDHIPQMRQPEATPLL